MWMVCRWVRRVRGTDAIAASTHEQVHPLTIVGRRIEINMACAAIARHAEKTSGAFAVKSRVR